MNFVFKVEDVVRFRDDCPRQPRTRMALVKEFVGKAWWAKTDTGAYLRVRSNELLLLFRPSEEVERRAVEARKVERKRMRDFKDKTVRRNQEAFAHMEEYKVPLTATGLPDKRYKPKYTVQNVPRHVLVDIQDKLQQKKGAKR